MREKINFTNFFFTESPGLSRPMSAMGGGGGIYNNPTSLIDSPDGGPVSGTENPLWIDQKYKAYEEQELTMTVFSDQVSLISIDIIPNITYEYNLRKLFASTIFFKINRITVL